MSKTAFWLWSLLRPYRFRILLGGGLVAITILSNVGLLATSAVLLSKAALLPPLLLLMPLITGVRFFGISRAVWRYAERLFNHSVAFRILSGLREKIYERLEPLVPDRLPNYSVGRLYNRLIADIDALQFFYLRAVAIPLGMVLVCLVSGWVLHFICLPAGVFLSFSLLFVGIGVPLFMHVLGRTVDAKNRWQRDELTVNWRDFEHGLKDLYFRPGRFGFMKKLQRETAQDAYLAAHTSRLESITQALVFFFSHLSALAVFWLTIPSVSEGHLSGVYLAMSGLVVLAAFESVQTFPQALLELRASWLAAKDVSETIAEKIPLEGKGSELRHLDLLVKDVFFHYHLPQKRFIENVNFFIPEGQHVAFLGRSGSGKTTVAKLLLGLWRPDRGDIFLGDTPLPDIKEEVLRARIGILEQQPSFFHTSLRENLLLVAPQADDERLWQVLETVQLAEVVRGLPDGLSTLIGERGMHLSGGERQRLALARVFLQDPDVLILDEPMQHLDGVTAELLEQLLRKWGKGKTVITITHSLRQMPAFDFIYLFDHGKIIASGTHEALLAQDETYQAMWTLEQTYI